MQPNGTDANLTLSIIIPSFQHGDEIGFALNSISEQNFSSYEILIMDGGSIDNTVTQVAAFSHLPVSLHQSPDKGVYDAMNKGIKLAKGEWLYFMGCDDKIYDANVFNSINNYFNDKNIDVIYGDVILTGDASLYGGKFNIDRLLRSENICHQAIFYRKKVFDKLGLYNLKYPIWADWEFNVRCFRHPSLAIKHINRIICLYNNQSGVSHAYDSVFAEELPVHYLGQIKLLELQKKNILQSKSFLIGNKIVNILASFSKFLRPTK